MINMASNSWTVPALFAKADGNEHYLSLKLFASG